MLEQIDLDVNALVQEVDIAALVARAGIDQVVHDATTGIATRALDMARRQLLGIDIVILGLIDQILRRRHDDQPKPLDGQRSAGPLSRAVGFLIDSVTVSALFGLGVSLVGYLLHLFTGRSLAGSGGCGVADRLCRVVVSLPVAFSGDLWPHRGQGRGRAPGDRDRRESTGRRRCRTACCCVSLQLHSRPRLPTDRIRALTEHLIMTGSVVDARCQAVRLTSRQRAGAGT